MAKRTRSAVLLGLVIGMLGATASLTPVASSIEETNGLQWLFALRGTRPPPANVLLVSADRASAEAMGLPVDPARWPRSLHARLVRNLKAAGARVIAFDIFFAEHDETAEDAELAAAMREAGNVILIARLNKRLVQLGDGSVNAGTEAITVQVQAPVPALRDSSLATAPFTLPAWPMKVSQFWAFHEGAGDRPTLPAVVLQAYARPEHGELQEILKRTWPQAADLSTTAARRGPAGLHDWMQALRERFQSDHGAAQALLRQLESEEQPAAQSQSRSVLRQVLRLYAGPASHYLNFFGPPGSIATVSYHQVLDGSPLHTADGRTVDLRDAIVFVGFAARTQPEQRDSFFTAFSQPTGLNLSGVEIAATATANLLEGRPLRPLDPRTAFVLLLAWGLYLGVVCRQLRGGPGILAAVISAMAYLGGSLALFEQADIWAPVVMPIFVQTPLAVLGGLLLQFRQIRHERQRMDQALGRYLPPRLIRQLVTEGVDANAAAELVHGTCMATDAAQYTRLAETLSPEELARTMNAYYDILFKEVERYGGQVSDVIGDAMMAIWASSGPESGTRTSACRAALAINAALQARAAGGDCAALVTRIGLHSGKIQLGHVGARQHLEYRAVGDIVNTATRIEGLSRHLGTRVLVSQETLAGVAGLLSREVGTFLLPGKNLPVVVHELLAMNPSDADRQMPDAGPFAEALDLFRSERWSDAAGLFRRCLVCNEADGPARFYLQLCESYLARGPLSFDRGAVRLTEK